MIEHKKRKIFEIYINFACNSRCIHCFNDKEFRKNPQLTFEEIVRVLYNSRKSGYNQLNILGGEPTIYPQIEKIIKFAIKIGYEDVFIFSNGLKLSSMEFVKKLKNAGLTSVNLSVFGHRKELHESITQINGSFENILSAIDNLTKNNIKIGLVLVVNKMNYLF